MSGTNNDPTRSRVDGIDGHFDAVDTALVHAFKPARAGSKMDDFGAKWIENGSN